MLTEGFEHRELRIDLREPDELFEPRAADVVGGAPAIDAGIDRIRNALGATRTWGALRLAILLPREHVTPAAERGIRQALGRYCEAGVSRAENELRAVQRDGWRTLLFGAIVLALGLAASEAALHAGWPTPLRDFFGNGLFIVVAWVGLWYPLDTLIYAGRPYRMELKVLRAIHRSELVVRAADEAGAG
jgi:hypothetical protein